MDRPAGRFGWIRGTCGIAGFGIPIYYERMSEPERSKVQALAAESPAVPAKWVTCVTYPLRGSNNPDQMWRVAYNCMALWADEDARIARLAMEDVTDCIEHDKWLLPALGVVGIGEIDFDTDKVKADWRDDPEVQYFCSLHGYVPAAAAMSPGR